MHLIVLATSFVSPGISLPLVHIGPALLTLVLGFGFIVCGSSAVERGKQAVHMLLFEIHPLRAVMQPVKHAIVQLGLALACLYAWHFLVNA